MTVEQMAIAGLFTALSGLAGAVIRYLVREIEKRDSALQRQSTIIERLADQVPEMVSQNTILARQLAQSEEK